MPQLIISGIYPTCYYKWNYSIVIKHFARQLFQLYLFVSCTSLINKNDSFGTKMCDSKVQVETNVMKCNDDRFCVLIDNQKLLQDE